MQRSSEALSNHHDHHEAEKSSWALWLSAGLNFGVAALQLIASFFSYSISLRSDALHNFSDVLSLLFSAVARRLARRQGTEHSTFGLRRAQTMAAFVNALTLLVLAFFIIEHSIIRLAEGAKVLHPAYIMIFALLSLVVNALSALFLERGAHGSLNMRSAYVHLLTDVMSSLAVLIGGAVMARWHVYWIDPVLSLVIAGYLVQSAFGLARSSFFVLMDFTPTPAEAPTIEHLQAIIEESLQVQSVHHVHYWQVGEGEFFLEVHLQLRQDMMVSESEQLVEQIKKRLLQAGVSHATLECELRPEHSQDLIQG